MNTSTNTIQNWIKSFAVKNWQKYTYKKEWASVIVLLLVLKLATSAISIFSGFFYLDNFFFGFLNSGTAAIVFAVAALLIIEGLNALFLAKFFKFAIRCEFVTALMPLTCALLTFTISFFVSCNGIALFTSEAEDLTKVIEAKYADLQNSAKADFDATDAEMLSYIETIKANPEGWKDGRRCVLSAEQNREMATAYENITNAKMAYNKRITELDTKKREELSANNKATTDTADKYYKIVAFIMFIQVGCSAALWFFWSKISAQDAADVEYKESVDAVYQKANSLIDDGVSHCISQKFSAMTMAFSQLNDELRAQQVAAAAALRQPQTAHQRAGFAVPEPPNNAVETPQNFDVTTAEKNAGTVAVSDVVNVATTAQNAVNTTAFCEHCGKALTPSQVVRHAKYCSPRCRVQAFNERNPNRKPIVIATTSLKD